MCASATPIIVEGTYPAPIHAVWLAITDASRMRQWFFAEMADFRPKVGFQTQFTVRFEGQDFVHQWQVTDVVPGHRIVYSWRYGGFPGDSTVAWELTETPGGTRLTLTHTGQETFPKEVPAFSRESCQAGWDYFLRESLGAFLGRPLL